MNKKDTPDYAFKLLFWVRLGIGPNPQSPSPIPNPQSPIPNPQSPNPQCRIDFLNKIISYSALFIYIMCVFMFITYYYK